MIKKKNFHFRFFADFNAKKLSANEANTEYTLGVNEGVITGVPDIPYYAVVFIKDTKQIWTHGALYDYASGQDLEDLKKVVEDNEIVTAKALTTLNERLSECEEGTRQIVKASVTTDGLMSKEDKAKLDSFDSTISKIPSNYYNKTAIDTKFGLVDNSIKAVDEKVDALPQTYELTSIEVSTETNSKANAEGEVFLNIKTGNVVLKPTSSSTYYLKWDAEYDTSNEISSLTYKKKGTKILDSEGEIWEFNGTKYVKLSNGNDVDDLREEQDTLLSLVNNLMTEGMGQTDYTIAFLEEKNMEALTSMNTQEGIIYIGLEPIEDAEGATYDETEHELVLPSDATYDETTHKLTLGASATFDSTTHSLTL